MKGRIIGREGRNIRALENATGCDIIIDETPDAVTLSGFDPVRREIARLALSRLVADGRIHPARIEEVVAKAKQEIEQVIKEEGEQAAYKAGVHGLPAEILRTLGRLRFRTSYGQNVLDHSVESSFLAGMIAAELKADVQTAKRGALLHDIGKAVDHEVEGPHALIGGDIAKRCNLPAKIVNCIAAHHYDVEPESPEALITMVADAISGGRPGARRESIEHYVKRLEAVENVANSFTGVERSFAIQAGREVRILVKPEEIDDLASLRLARDVAKKIEESLQYPGQIKVTVIRETRSIEFAR
jgi:ribonuclease Y